ncbi:hypothetical protein B0J14DRAFT_666037 [Halenospora varia]|nr:hypothetical protein B0J14DRAFT_666037 [Halenospora varia]
MRLLLLPLLHLDLSNDLLPLLQILLLLFHLSFPLPLIVQRTSQHRYNLRRQLILQFFHNLPFLWFFSRYYPLTEGISGGHLAVCDGSGGVPEVGGSWQLGIRVRTKSHCWLWRRRCEYTCGGAKNA